MSVKYYNFIIKSLKCLEIFNFFYFITDVFNKSILYIIRQYLRGNVKLYKEGIFLFKKKKLSISNLKLNSN